MIQDATGAGTFPAVTGAATATVNSGADHVLLADDAQATSETGTSPIQYGYPLWDDVAVNLTDDEGALLLGSNTLNDALTANSVESASESGQSYTSVGYPLQDDSGVNLTDDLDLLLLGSNPGDAANVVSVESASETEAGVLEQVHILLALNGGIESASEAQLEGNFDARDVQATSETAQATIASLFLSATYDLGPDPDTIDFILDGTYTGVMYWRVDVPTVIGPTAIEAGGGEAAGSFAVTSSAGSDTFDLNSVATGNWTLHVVFKRTSDGAYSNIIREDLVVDNTIEFTTSGPTSLSAVSTPALTVIPTNALLADDTESASEVSVPIVLTGDANIFADDVQSASEVGAATIGIGILANDVESASLTTNTVLRQTHVLLALNGGVESTSEVTTPAVGGANLTTNDVESLSTTSAGFFAQRHFIGGSAGAESASETSPATLFEATVSFLADYIESASEVTEGTVTQINDLLADDTESASTTDGVALDSVQGLLADDIESASEVTEPDTNVLHVIFGNSVETTSETSAVNFIAGEVVNLVGISMVGEVSTPNVWGELDPDGDGGYNNIDPAQDPTWVEIEPSQSAGWDETAA